MSRLEKFFLLAAIFGTCAFWSGLLSPKQLFFVVVGMAGLWVLFIFYKPEQHDDC